MWYCTLYLLLQDDFNSWKAICGGGINHLRGLGVNEGVCVNRRPVGQQLTQVVATTIDGRLTREPGKERVVCDEATT